MPCREFAAVTVVGGDAEAVESVADRHRRDAADDTGQRAQIVGSNAHEDQPADIVGNWP